MTWSTFRASAMKLDLSPEAVGRRLRQVERLRRYCQGDSWVDTVFIASQQSAWRNRFGPRFPSARLRRR